MELSPKTGDTLSSTVPASVAAIGPILLLVVFILAFICTRWHKMIRAKVQITDFKITILWRRRRSRKKEQQLLRAVITKGKSMDKRKSNLMKTSPVKVALLIWYSWGAFLIFSNKRQSDFVVWILTVYFYWAILIYVQTKGRTSKPYPATKGRPDGWRKGKDKWFFLSKFQNIFLLDWWQLLAFRWGACWSRQRRW